MDNNWFFYRFSAINFVGFILLGLAGYWGFISLIYTQDVSHITSLIGLTWLGGLILSFYKAHRLNKEISNSASDQSLDFLSVKMLSDIEIVRHIANMLLLLGISGTIVGIILALKSVETFTVNDPTKMQQAIIMLFGGIQTKFYCSLLGIIGHIWLINNHALLENNYNRYMTSE